MLTTPEGWLIIVAYFVLTITYVILTQKKGAITKDEFLVGGRRMSWIKTSFSMAATWIWAPALFVASELAYKSGWVGVSWFIIPNIGTLLLFAYFGQSMRNRFPEGWTVSSCMLAFSKRVHNLFLVETFTLQILSLSVQLLAGAAIFSKISGANFFHVTLAMALVPLLYTLVSGIGTSIKTDFWKMVIIIGTLIIGLPFVVLNSEGFSFLGEGGAFTNPFSGAGLETTLAFGIPTTIGLLSGAFGDQMFWQRTFSVPKSKVRKMMYLAALIFAIVPISFSLFGFAARGSGMEIENTQLTNAIAAIEFAPKWFMYLFFALILSGLLSTVDSILSAVSSVAGHDILQRWKLPIDSVRMGRIAMVVVTVLGIVIANIPGITIIYLFLVYGTLRSAVMLPTIYLSRGKKMSEKGLFYGLLIAMTVGFPLFAIGKLNAITWLIVLASLFTISIPAILPLIMDKSNRKTINNQ